MSYVYWRILEDYIYGTKYNSKMSIPAKDNCHSVILGRLLTVVQCLLYVQGWYFLRFLEAICRSFVTYRTRKNSRVTRYSVIYDRSTISRFTANSRVFHLQRPPPPNGSSSCSGSRAMYFSNTNTPFISTIHNTRSAYEPHSRIESLTGPVAARRSS